MGGRASPSSRVFVPTGRLLVPFAGHPLSGPSQEAHSPFTPCLFRRQEDRPESNPRPGLHRRGRRYSEKARRTTGHRGAPLRLGAGRADRGTRSGSAGEAADRRAGLLTRLGTPTTEPAAAHDRILREEPARPADRRQRLGADAGLCPARSGVRRLPCGGRRAGGETQPCTVAA